jgi:hypothetical protein
MLAMTSTLVAVGHPADRGAFAARLGAMTQIVFAGLLGIVASFGAEPGFLPRGAVLFLTFAVPGLVGWLGVERRRPALLVAAGLTSFVGSFIAFSGVTLIFLIPALLLLAGAVRVQVSEPPRGRVAMLPALGRAVAACAVLVMVVGAGASALLLTDNACWVEYQAGTEPRIQAVPYTTGEMSVPANATSMSCSTGVISVRGVGLGGLLWTGALVLAERSSRRRDAATNP